MSRGLLEGSSLPGVAIWRNEWLPPSETFIARHVRGLTRYRAVPIGMYAGDPSLGVKPVVAPFPPTDAGNAARWASAALGYPGVYDDALDAADVRVIHAHFGTDAVHALPLARRRGLPLVVTFHGYDARLAMEEGFRERFISRLPMLFDEAAVIIAVSRCLADLVLDLGAPPEKVQVRYLGVPVTEPLADPCSPREGIAFVGRLIDGKGVLDVLAAVDRLPASLRSLPVFIAGDGPLRSQVEALGHEHGLDVRMLGTLAPQRVAELLSQVQVMVGPSSAKRGYLEALGLVFLEAALAGTPVVTYDNGGIPEAVVSGTTGLVVPDGDVAQLSAAVESLLSDPELAVTYGRAGQARVVADFDQRDRIAELEDLYDEISTPR